MVDFSVSDKVVVITGGAGVIGSSLSENFLRAGANIVILNRNQEKIDQLMHKLSESVGNQENMIGRSCDVLNKDDLIAAKNEILAKFGKIDILINAAGGNIPGATQAEGQVIFDLDMNDIDRALTLNLNGTIYPSLIFGEAMAGIGKGSIINISSMATFSAISRVMGYSVGKTGVNSFTRWLACELADKYGDKVRVNAIAPGFFIGAQNRKLLLNEDGSLTERSKKVINKTPMRRFGDIKELNGAVQFLCSDAATFITGVVLPVDGGFSAFSGV